MGSNGGGGGSSFPLIPMTSTRHMHEKVASSCVAKCNGNTTDGEVSCSAPLSAKT